MADSSMPSLSTIDRSFWAGKRVFVTGHTGFKGGWLSAWLAELGAEVTGYALAPDPAPAFFTRCGLAGRVASIEADVRDAARLQEAVHSRAPEIVFHLAAQPLVLRSHRAPAETFEINVMGTAHLLDAVRAVPGVRAVVAVTSDKCYDNLERGTPFREGDPLGGRDPYSASKACAELVAAAYRASFFSTGGPVAAVATARAGNVFGGGDLAEDRLIPDAVRALRAGRPLIVRNPKSVRPWQHVLEPLSGYLMLAERLAREGAAWAEAWNFGPDRADAVPVADLADRLIRRWGSGRWEAGGPAAEGAAPVEAGVLILDSAKARERLGWRPRLPLDEAVAWTVEWYREAFTDRPAEALYDLARRQIAAYSSIR
jgi:CDP-glucose 4,6-dehydratase